MTSAQMPTTTTRIPLQKLRLTQLPMQRQLLLKLKLKLELEQMHSRAAALRPSAHARQAMSTTLWPLRKRSLAFQQLAQGFCWLDRLSRP